MDAFRGRLVPWSRSTVCPMSRGRTTTAGGSGMHNHHHRGYHIVVAATLAPATATTSVTVVTAVTVGGVLAFLGEGLGHSRFLFVM